MPPTVYLVRHGSVVGAETRRFIGHLDVPLSPLGERQMDRLASRLQSITFEAVYASDLVRARRSAEILAAPHGLTPVAVPELREFDMGRWEGLTAEQIRGLDDVAFKTWMADVAGYQFPEGESLATACRASLARVRANRGRACERAHCHRRAWRHQPHDPVSGPGIERRAAAGAGARLRRPVRAGALGRAMDVASTQ